MRGTTENTNHEKLTLASPLAVIARHLADKYFYRPFPVPAKGGLLDYAEIRSKPVYPIDPDAPKKLYRELHGFQNAVRTAMAIPVLFDLYRKHKDSLTPNIRGAIDSVTELWIKKVQIVALMRAAGRHHDTGKGSQFCEQAERECNHFLRQIGISDVEADQLSKTLIYAEGPRKTKTLAASLLADAATIETFRDFAGEKKVQMAWFAFCQHLETELPRQAAMDDFVAVCSHHARVIKSQQGYIFHALRDEKGHPVKGWPELTPRSERNDAVEQVQKVFEHDARCFELCGEAIISGRLPEPKVVVKKIPAARMETRDDFFKPMPYALKMMDCTPRSGNHLPEKTELADKEKPGNWRTKLFDPCPSHLLTEAHFKALEMLKIEVLPLNLVRAWQVTDKSKKLSAIVLTFNHGVWTGQANAILQEQFNAFSLKPLDFVSFGTSSSWEFSQESIRKLPYLELDKKFGGDLPMELEDSVLDILQDLHKSIVNAMHIWERDYHFEKRMSNFDPETRTASGDLKTIMLKISLPSGIREWQAEWDYFKWIFIKDLKVELGEDNYRRLVVGAGDAVDRSAFIAFDVEELKKGLKVVPTHSFMPR